MTLADQVGISAVIVGAIGALTGLVGLVIAVTANSINKAASKAQKDVAERQMYLSLIERRTKWFNEFRDAMLARQRELRNEVDAWFRKIPRPQRWPIEHLLDSLLGEAEWLFDENVKGLAQSVLSHLDQAFVTYRDWYQAQELSGLETDGFPEQLHISAAHEDFGRIQEAMRRYLFVGDIYQRS